jgi:hypothetical protein
MKSNKVHKLIRPFEGGQAVVHATITEYSATIPGLSEFCICEVRGEDDPVTVTILPWPMPFSVGMKGLVTKIPPDVSQTGSDEWVWVGPFPPTGVGRYDSQFPSFPIEESEDFSQHSIEVRYTGGTRESPEVAWVPKLVKNYMPHIILYSNRLILLGVENDSHLIVLNTGCG